MAEDMEIMVSEAHHENDEEDPKRKRETSCET